MNSPSAIPVSRMPWRFGRVAASSVSVMIAAAGTVTPKSPSRQPSRVIARIMMTSSTAAAEATIACRSGMNSCAKYMSG